MPDSPARTLVVVRHAKAEQVAATDARRALSARGHDDAAEAGRWLAGTGVVARHALVSAAIRAEQTWRSLAAAAGWDLEPDLDRGLYEADVETALDLVRGVDGAADTVVVVGHNPTMASLAHALDDGAGEPAAANALAVGAFPTAAVAVLSYRGAWADLGPSAATLVGYHVGRG